MIKNPIQAVTNKLQYRAIGIVNGIYTPNNMKQLNRGALRDKNGKTIETVVLGKALSLLKKYINLEKTHFWIVYPRNKNTTNLHLQVAGIWDPYELDKLPEIDSKRDPKELLEELNLNDNYFSIRGELVYVNTKKKELVIKICSLHSTKKLKNNIFKLTIEGEIPLDFLNSFISLDVIRDGNTLRLVNYEVVEKEISKNKEL